MKRSKPEDFSSQKFTHTTKNDRTYVTFRLDNAESNIDHLSSLLRLKIRGSTEKAWDGKVILFRKHLAHYFNVFTQKIEVTFQHCKDPESTQLRVVPLRSGNVLIESDEGEDSVVECDGVSGEIVHIPWPETETYSPVTKELENGNIIMIFSGELHEWNRQTQSTTIHLDFEVTDLIQLRDGRIVTIDKNSELIIRNSVYEELDAIQLDGEKFIWRLVESDRGVVMYCYRNVLETVNLETTDVELYAQLPVTSINKLLRMGNGMIVADCGQKIIVLENKRIKHTLETIAPTIMFITRIAEIAPNVLAYNTDLRGYPMYLDFYGYDDEDEEDALNSQVHNTVHSLNVFTGETGQALHVPGLRSFLGFKF